ncbi:MAG: hypothetical protein IIT41_01715 [Oscillospiraceae bacterium]|nr:hypothetical protein [Oscillospiraceae bacterium]
MNRIELYSREVFERQEKQNRIWKTVLIAIAAAAVIAEIILFVLTNTKNQQVTIYWIIGVAVVAGWIIIYFNVFRRGVISREAQHAENMLTGEREELEGTLKLSDEVLRIKKSITIRKAELYNADGRHRLNVHVDRAALLPEGKVRVWTVSNYIAAFEAPEGYEPSGKAPKKKHFRFLRNVLSQLHSFAAWAIVAAIFTGWIFTNVTDTKAANKVEIFINAYETENMELRLELEENLPEGIRMIKVHKFTEALFGDRTFLNADIYIVRASDVEELRDAFSGEGIKVYDAETGRGAADGFISYWVPGAESEDYYLFYGINSLHTGKQDTAAFYVAERFMEIGKEAEK